MRDVWMSIARAEAWTHDRIAPITAGMVLFGGAAPVHPPGGTIDGHALLIALVLRRGALSPRHGLQARAAPDPDGDLRRELFFEAADDTRTRRRIFTRPLARFESVAFTSAGGPPGDRRFELRAGACEHVALVGRSGVGKSTVVALLMPAGPGCVASLASLTTHLTTALPGQVMTTLWTSGRPPLTSEASRLRAMSGDDEYPHPEPYNPLSEANLARAIREELERQPLRQLPLSPFWGAGLYALYYVGDLPVYDGVNDPACATPIYVGKAAAGRSSYGAFIAGSRTKKLLNRIHDHMRSIEEAHINLSLTDFRVRYLVTSDVHIVLGEAGLLQAYAPVLWNTVVTGFGINQPGAGRRGQRKSRWDTLHPGRPRAEGRQPNEKSVEELTEMIRKVVEARSKGEGVRADVVADELDLDADPAQDDG